MKFYFDGISLQNKRQSNMDSLLIRSASINGKEILLACICDGVGSLQDGAFASGTAIRMLNDWFSELENSSLIGLKMRDVILEINSHLVIEAKRMNLNAASTISALLIKENAYYIVHAGDSRIYCYENNVLNQLTNDDVSASGKITASIGQTTDTLFQYAEGIAAKKTFLLCTDGLHNKVDSCFIAESLKQVNKRTINDVLDSLANHAIECGEKDNISLALVKSERWC